MGLVSFEDLILWESYSDAVILIYLEKQLFPAFLRDIFCGSYDLGVVLPPEQKLTNVHLCWLQQSFISGLFSLYPIPVLDCIFSKCSININTVLKLIIRLSVFRSQFLDSVTTTLYCFRERRPVWTWQILLLASLPLCMAMQSNLITLSLPVFTSSLWVLKFS